MLMLPPEAIPFRSHAAAWQDALPVGNGRTGLLMFGGLAEEQLILNHAACWLPLEPRRSDQESLADVLPEVRRLIRDGQPRAAELLWLERCRSADMRYVGTDSCHPAGCLRITTTGLGDSLGFRRWLDPRHGEVGATWQQPGVGTWQRRTWVDRHDDIAVWQQTAPHPVSLTVRLDDAAARAAEAWIASTYPGIDPEGWQGTTVLVRDLVTITTGTDGDISWLRGTYRHGRGGWIAAVRLPGGQWEKTKVRTENVENLQATTAPKKQHQLFVGASRCLGCTELGPVVRPSAPF